MAVSNVQQPREFGSARPRSLAAVSVESLAAELAEEFGAPVGLLDPAGQIWLARHGAPAEDFPEARAVQTDGRGVSLGPLTGPGGPTWLVLPVPGPGGGGLVAVAGFAPSAALARPTWGPPCPDRALRAWGRAVAEGRRRAAGGSSRGREPAWADRLIQRLRVSDSPDRFQRLATGSVRAALDVEAVAWVPASTREPVVVAGEVAGRSSESFRRLISETAAEAIWISNRPIGSRAAGFRRIAVAAAEGAGWLIAVNPRDERPFAAEAEALQTVACLIATQRANSRLYSDLKELLFGVIRALTSAIDAKDPYTSGHSERVARIAVRLGQELGMSPTERGDLYLMGLLHDVGKIGVEDDILKKPGKLTPEEYRAIQAHVRIGVHILTDLTKLNHLLPGVAHHHESLDGSGYPDGLSGESIPLPARVLAVADAFDAMSSTRPYRRRMTPSQIDEIFRNGAGVQWDPKVVSALFACRADLERIRQKGLGESLHRVVNETLGRS